ncbi:hypothetical protein H311_04809, partial [Anncaliia algerae PRA109]
RRKRLADNKVEEHFVEKKKNFTEKVKYSSRQRNVNEGIVFRRGEEERSVRRSLFIIEGEEGFEEKSLRSKMTEVIRSSSRGLQDRFYELGIENRLPKDWEAFKNFIVEFCAERDISSIRKYNNESWYEYITRLSEWSKIRGYSDEEILKKLRKEKLPNVLQMICYSVESSIESVMKRVKEYEKSSYEHNLRIDLKGNMDNYDENKKRKQNEIRCYLC